jgi:hypothetical protein
MAASGFDATRYTVQEAVIHGPGRCSSVLLYDRKPGVGDEAVRLAAASLLASVRKSTSQMTDRDLPDNAHILVGLGARTLGGFKDIVPAAFQEHPSMTLLSDRGLAHEPHDLFVQVAADTELDRTLALRVLDAFCGEALSVVQACWTVSSTSVFATVRCPAPISSPRHSRRARFQRIPPRLDCGYCFSPTRRTSGASSRIMKTAGRKSSGEPRRSETPVRPPRA